MTLVGMGRGVGHAASSEGELGVRSGAQPLRSTVTLSAKWLPSSSPEHLPSATRVEPMAPRPGRQVVRLGAPVLAPPAAPKRRPPRLTTATLAPRMAPSRATVAWAEGTTGAPEAVAMPQTATAVAAPAAHPPVAVKTVRVGAPGRWSAKGPARLLWTGFKSQDGNAQVTLQVTKPVTPRVVKRPGRVVLVLPKCRLQNRLAAKPLDTRYFAGSVDAVAPHQKGRNVEIDVRLRQQVDTAEPERREGPRGSSLWVVGLPPSGAAPAPSQAVAEATVPHRSRHRR